MIGSLERIFRRVIRYNVQEIGGRILCPVCKSLINPHDEINALDNFFVELKKLERNPLDMKIPSNLRILGIFGGNILVEAYRTHSRTVKFPISENIGLKGAETSDIVVLVTHEYIKPNAKILVDEKISFFQAKIEKNGRLFKIKPRQWYLMRYWPEFFYKKGKFNLISCRRVPDVCSFFLFLYKQRLLNNRIFGNPFRTWNCKINSVSLSTPYIEEKMPNLRNLTREDLLKNIDKSLRLTQEDGDGFFSLLWYLLLTHLGVHDSHGVMLMKTMFPEISDENDPRSDEEIKEKPSIGIRIRVQLKTESFMK